jgi:hypothetical protein
VKDVEGVERGDEQAQRGALVEAQGFGDTARVEPDQVGGIGVLKKVGEGGALRGRSAL